MDKNESSRSQPDTRQPRGVFLTFDDPGVEQGFRDSFYRENRRWIAVAPLLALAMNFAFVMLDRTLISAEFRDLFSTVRLGVITPICIAGFAVAVVLRNYRVIVPVYGFGYALIGLCLTGLLIGSGIDNVDYVAWAISQSALLACVLLGLPFAWSLPLVTMVVTLYFGAVAFLVRDWTLFANVFLGTGFLIFLAMLAAYRYENASRNAFLAEQGLRDEYQRRLKAEHEQSQWLRTIAGFVRHELKNAIAGVGSSLQLAARAPLQPATEEYLGRAAQRLDFMRQFLQKVADATSLEDALQLQETETVDFSEVVKGSLDALREDHSDVKVIEDIHPRVQVRGSPESLVQVLDKLLNNAVEHLDAAHPIVVCLSVREASAVLSIANIGDALPENSESIFQPFVSNKPKGRDGNLGLGLYVARVIVAHHDGTIAVEALENPSGARFIVSLPLADDR